METYSSSYSSANKSYLSQNPEKAKGQKHAYPFKSHNSLLHSVRKSQAKPWKKAPIAPMPPTPVKVYKVDSLNFKDLVQQLTGAPEFKSHQPHHQLLHETVTRAATSLDVALPPSKDIAEASPPVGTNWYQDFFQSEAFGVKTQETITTDEAMKPGLLDMTLSSPSSYSNWCFFPLLSPGTMTSLESGTVL